MVPLPGRRHAEHLGEAVHRVGGVHARAGAAGRTGLFLEFEQLFVRDFAGVRKRPRASDAAEKLTLQPFTVPASIGPPLTKMVGQVEAGRGHEQAGHVFVAVRHHHEAVKAVRHGHRLGAVGNEVARDERIFHALRGPWRCRRTRRWPGRPPGVPPAMATPSFTASTILSMFMWPGHDLVLGADDADERPVTFLPLVKPSALNSARCGAFCSPLMTDSLFMGGIPSFLSRVSVSRIHTSIIVVIQLFVNGNSFPRAAFPPQARARCEPGKTGARRRSAPGMNRVRARPGEGTNSVRVLPAAGAGFLPAWENKGRARARTWNEPRACETRGGKRHGARIARRSRATCSPQARGCAGLFASQISFHLSLRPRREFPCLSPPVALFPA